MNHTQKINEAMSRVQEIKIMVTIASGLLSAQPVPIESMKATLLMVNKLTTDLESSISSMSQIIRASDARITFLTTPKVKTIML
jgi:cell division protein FtsL